MNQTERPKPKIGTHKIPRRKSRGKSSLHWSQQ
jgi:hypothetical protein